MENKLLIIALHVLAVTFGYDIGKVIEVQQLAWYEEKAEVLLQNGARFQEEFSDDNHCGVHNEAPEIFTETNNPDPGPRFRRSLSVQPEKYMEVLLVTDNSVVNFHGAGFLQQYLMTQMNLVDEAYHHPSLHMEINIIVTEIHVVDDRTANDIVVIGDGKHTLDRFCEWANRHRYSDPHYPRTFDVALYITRKDIGPAGYAPVTGMCHPQRSCAVNKDAGISSAYVITHEIGHILGMVHDGYGNNCDREAEDGKVMSATVQANYDNVHWTECSRRSLEHYISGLLCLDDRPKKPDWPRYTQPYGNSWSLDEQCRQEFGEGYKVCRVFTSMDMCDMLWCSSDKEHFMCKTKRSPPLPGTSCGHNKWCMNRRCVEQRAGAAAMDGGWTDWSEWSECSRSCGVGVQFKYRRCTNPTPLHGGKDCHGENEKLQICNKQPCEKHTDFRAEQCSSYDHTNFLENQRHTWLPTPAKNDEDQCKLTCISAQTGVTFVSEKTVVDGTRCSYDDEDDICIRGKCYPVGCDGDLGSSKRADDCGVCGGDGSTCTTVSGRFDEILTRKEYHKMLTLPAGARNIFINELPVSPHLAHFLAIESDGMYLLNSKEHQDESTSIIVHGAKFTYNSRGSETLVATGPLLASAHIMVFSLSDKLPATIDYRYSVPIDLMNNVETDLHSVNYEYTWQKLGWSDCTKTCDGGTMSKIPSCTQINTDKEVPDYLCKEEDKPETETKPCNTDPCFVNTYSWRPTSWSECTATCGKGAVRNRKLRCFVINLYGLGIDWQVEEKLCDQDNVPETIEKCDKNPCEEVWLLGEWGECSKTCGYGLQRRTVRCGENNINPDACIGEEPNGLRLCKGPPCTEIPSRTELPSPTSTTSSTTSSSPTPLLTSTTAVPTAKAAATTATATTTISTTAAAQTTQRTTKPTVSTGTTSTTLFSTIRSVITSPLPSRTPQILPTSTKSNEEMSVSRARLHASNEGTNQQGLREDIGNSLISNVISPNSDTERQRHRHGYHKNRISNFISDNQDSVEGSDMTYDRYRNNYIHNHINSVSTTTLPPEENNIVSKRPHLYNPGHNTCVKDKSFFCQMKLEPEKCTLPLYAKYCCITCMKLLNMIT